MGGKILYMRNHQLTKEASSEKNNFFSLSETVKLYRVFDRDTLERYTKKDLCPLHPRGFFFKWLVVSLKT